MDCPHRHKFFAVLFVATFVGAMWVCTNWVVDITTYASIPVILFAETIVLGMLYATFFHGEPEHAKHEAPVVAPRESMADRQKQVVQFGSGLKNRSA